MVLLVKGEASSQGSDAREHRNGGHRHGGRKAGVGHQRRQVVGGGRFQRIQT